MIRIVTLAMVLLVAALPVAAQEDDEALHELLTVEAHDQCNDYLHNAQLLIPDLYAAGEIDSIYLIIDYIAVDCGLQAHALKSIGKLIDIERGEFDDPLCDEHYFETIFDYWRLHGVFLVHDVFSSTLGFHPRFYSRNDSSAYNLFLSDLNQSLLEITDTTSLEHVYCRFVAHDFDYIINRLKQGLYPGTCLQEEYDSRLAQVKYDLAHGNRTHWSVGMGIWSPRGASEILGNKAELGGSFGLRLDRYLIDIAGSFRFLNAAEPYRVHSNGSIRTTDHFFSAYVGIEFGYELVRADRFGLDLHTGIGYDGIESYKKGEGDYESINSGNLNFGITPRLFVDRVRTRYLGLQLRYNIVKYGTGGGSDLSGNTLSLCLVYGSLVNHGAVYEAKQLRYYD